MDQSKSQKKMCKLGTKTAKSCSSLCMTLSPIYYTNASADPMHHPKPQLWWFTNFHTATAQSPNWWQCGIPHSSPKLPLQWTDTQIQLPASFLTHPTLPSLIDLYLISRFAATHWTDKQMSRWLEGMIDDNRPLSLYRELCELIIYTYLFCDITKNVQLSFQKSDKGRKGKDI